MEHAGCFGLPTKFVDFSLPKSLIMSNWNYHLDIYCWPGLDYRNQTSKPEMKQTLPDMNPNSSVFRVSNWIRLILQDSSFLKAAEKAILMRIFTCSTPIL